MEEKLGKQGFFYDANELFEPITEIVEDTSWEVSEESKATIKELRNRIKKLSL